MLPTRTENYTQPLIGLSEREVAIRRKQGLGNEVKLKTSRSYLEILRSNLFTFFNLVLFALGIALVVLGRPVEAVITSGVVLINVFVAMIQEVRAKHKLDQIALLTNPKVKVIRDGHEAQLNPGEIVQGDLLIIETGDQIVVDGMLVGDGILNVDESLISGESSLIQKRKGDQLYSGSFCVSGRSVYIAQKVGAESLVNKLASDAREYSWEYTPLQREVNLIIRVLLGVVMFFLILTTIDAALGKTSFLDSIRAASVLFGLAPNSLFLMIVVAYAWGAVRIAGRGALVQQANSIESLCNVTTLCLDKTGTLTTNRIKLDEIMATDRANNKQLSADLHKILGTFARSISTTNRTSQAISDAYPGQVIEPVDEVLFSSELGWSGLSFDSDIFKGTYILGAPEKLILEDSKTNPLFSSTDSPLTSWIDERTGRGLRVLLFASSPEILPLHDDQEKPVLPSEVNPLCLLCFSDELRNNVRQTLRGFVDVGVNLKIISGDNPQTVLSLAKQAGLNELIGELHAVSGIELEEMDQTTFSQTALEANIFGRVTPRMKEKLVETIREHGQYVAMTGDGVNDVLALKKANLGIAMQSGSPAARNVADLILLKDTFAVLPPAFSEGQRILNGMQDILKLYLTRILYFALLVAAIGWVGGGSPFTPKGNSLISIFTLAIPAFALALWARPGPVPKLSLTRRLLHYVLPAGITCCAAGLVVYLYFLVQTGDMLYAQQTLTYAMVVIGLLLLIFVEPASKVWVAGDELSTDWRPTILALGLFVVFLISFTIPYIADLYDLVPLRQWQDYLVIGGIILVWVITLHLSWRLHLLDKYLNVDLGGPKTL